LVYSGAGKVAPAPVRLTDEEGGFAGSPGVAAGALQPARLTAATRIIARAINQLSLNLRKLSSPFYIFSVVLSMPPKIVYSGYIKAPLI
jgi:hypothetical protein